MTMSKQCYKPSEVKSILEVENPNVTVVTCGGKTVFKDGNVILAILNNKTGQAHAIIRNRRLDFSKLTEEARVCKLQKQFADIANTWCSEPYSEREITPIIAMTPIMSPASLNEYLAENLSMTEGVEEFLKENMIVLHFGEVMNMGKAPHKVSNVVPSKEVVFAIEDQIGHTCTGLAVKNMRSVQIEGEIINSVMARDRHIVAKRARVYGEEDEYESPEEIINMLDGKEFMKYEKVEMTLKDRAAFKDSKTEAFFEALV